VFEFINEESCQRRSSDHVNAWIGKVLFTVKDFWSRGHSFEIPLNPVWSWVLIHVNQEVGEEEVCGNED